MDIQQPGNVGMSKQRSTSIFAARGGAFTSTPLLHIWSLPGIWIYSYGLEAG
jgi:hypothetical protein